MADEFSDILEGLARDVATEAKIAIGKARDLLQYMGPQVLRWETQAREAEVAGNVALAQSKRMSIQQVKNQAVLDIATHGVVVTDKFERAILAAFDRALAMLP